MLSAFGARREGLQQNINISQAADAVKPTAALPSGEMRGVHGSGSANLKFDER